MARNQFEDALRAVLEGGMQGYQAGRAGQQDIEKTLMLEKIKSAIDRENIKSNIEAYQSAIGKTGGGIKPVLRNGKLTYESPDIKDIDTEKAMARRPQLLATLGYTREAISKGANPNKIIAMTKPERFSTPDEQAIIEKVTTGARGLFEKGQQGRTNREMSLGKEFIGLKQIKDYSDLRPQIDLMSDIYKKIKSGQIQSANASDQAIVNTLGRMIDPGSTVREAEYARTPENMSLINRVDASIQKVQKGGVLNDSERQEVIRAARIIGNARGKLFNETLKNYQEQARILKLRPEIVTRGYKEHTPYNVEEGFGASKYIKMGTNSKGQRVGQLQDGTIEVIK